MMTGGMQQSFDEHGRSSSCFLEILVVMYRYSIKNALMIKQYNTNKTASLNHIGILRYKV
jgi:hypothetical protein